MNKIKKIIALLCVMILGVASFGCSGEERFTVYGDFICEIDDQYIILRGLSKEGKKKNAIIVPNEIDDYHVQVDAKPIKTRGVNWESKVLEKIYLSNDVMVIDGRFAIDIVGLKYVIRMEKSAYYFPLILNDDVIEITQEKSNMNVIFSSEKPMSFQEEIYWMDIVTDGKIEVMPPEPVQYGWDFGGWYKEKECQNAWDFENDVVPTPEFDEQGRCTNPTTLYAKWDLAENNSDYKSVDGVIYSENMKHLLLFPNNLKKNGQVVTEFTVPDYVESVGRYAFRGNKNLTKVNLGNARYLPEGVFSGCDNITEIVAPDLLSIESSNAIFDTAWYNNALQGSEPITLGMLYIKYIGNDENVEVNGYISIYDSAFRGCSSVKRIKLGTDVMSIGQYAFADCENLEELDLLDFSWVLRAASNNILFGSKKCKVLVSSNMKEEYSRDEIWGNLLGSV